MVHGRGEIAGKALVEHPDVPLISFTGSTATGATIGETCGRMHKRVSLEMGGKNAMIVMDDADLDLALEGVLWGAFGTTGQRCTATSRLILHRKIHDRFLRHLVSAAGALRLGDGRDGGPKWAPDPPGFPGKVERYVAIGLEEGAELVTGGRGPRVGLNRVVLPADHVRRREARQPAGTGGNFRPGAGVIRVGSLAEAIRVNNGVRYGLSSSIYTRNVNAAFRAMQELDNGITYINAPTIGAEAHLPFGGVKQTGNGHREGGWEVYDFYSETKVGYADFSGTLQRAQIDDYEGS